MKAVWTTHANSPSSLFIIKSQSWGLSRNFYSFFSLASFSLHREKEYLTNSPCIRHNNKLRGKYYRGCSVYNNVKYNFKDNSEIPAKKYKNHKNKWFNANDFAEKSGNFLFLFTAVESNFQYGRYCSVKRKIFLNSIFNHFLVFLVASIYIFLFPKETSITATKRDSR